MSIICSAILQCYDYRHLGNCEITFYKYKDKEKNTMIKRPNICYIFEIQGMQGYQIWNSDLSTFSRSIFCPLCPIRLLPPFKSRSNLNMMSYNATNAILILQSKKHNNWNKLASSVDATAISETWNYQSLWVILLSHLKIHMFGKTKLGVLVRHL